QMLAAAARGAPSAALLERIANFRARRKGRTQAEQQSGGDRDQGAEEKHRFIDFDLGSARGEALGELHEKPQRHRRQRQAQSSSYKRKQNGFRERWPQNAQLAGAKSDAYRQLTL